MDVRVVFGRMIMLVLIMFVGYLATVMKVFDKHANANFAALITYVTVPALVIASVEGAGEVGSKSDTLFVLLTATLMYLFTVGLAKFSPKLFRADKETEGIIEFLTIFTNNGFMGLPVVQAIFGTGALFYASLYGIPNNLLIYSLGVFLIAKGSKKSRANWKAILLNPGNIASLFAVFVFLFDIKLPTLVMDTATSIGNITSPLAMIIIGASLADIDILGAFKEWKIYLFAFYRMIVIPLFLWWALKGILTNPTMLGILVIIAAMPGPAMAVALSMQYGGNTAFSTRYVFISTLLSVFTIPFLAALLF